MRRALLVGINAYPAPNALGGCVADALNWKAYLETRQFSTLALTDLDAKRANILAALEELVLNSASGDKLAVGYSGHGTNVRDRSDDEPDGRDEAIVPVDYQSGQLIIDDDLRAIFDRLPRGVTLTVFLDSCYSGTATRLLGVNAIGRVTQPDARRKFLVLEPDDEAAYLDTRAALVPVARPVLSPDSMRHATVSACTPQEVAWESGGEGVFTRTALGVLRRSGTTLTLGGLLKRVLADLGPQREQTLDAPLYMMTQTLVRKAKA